MSGTSCELKGCCLTDSKAVRSLVIQGPGTRLVASKSTFQRDHLTNVWVSKGASVVLSSCIRVALRRMMLCKPRV